MDENTWRFAQLMMWLIGIQTTVLIAFIGGMWAFMNSRINKIDERLDKIETRLNSIETRVSIIEAILQMKECCMLKNDEKMKKTG